MNRGAKLARTIAFQVLALLLVSFCFGNGFSVPVAHAADQDSGQLSPDKLVQAKLIADTTAVVPGKPFRLGVALQMIPGWHTYYKQSGEAGMPTKITWELPAGFTASDFLWQKPNRFNDADITTYGYNDRTLIGATITPPANLKAGSNLTFGAKVKWLACKDQCVPGKNSLSLKLSAATKAAGSNAKDFEGLGWRGSVESLKIAGSEAVPGNTIAGSNTTTAVATTNAGSAQAAGLTGSILDADIKVADSGDQQMSLIAYLGLAFVGGFILNFMPCVLPVISIKVLSFMQQAGDDPKRVFRLGMTFTAGIVFSFLVLGGFVIAVQQAGQKIGWGFQFQYPIFLFGMAAVVLMFALSLFGLFYIQVSAGQDKIDKLASQEGYAGTFFKGVLATTLSTPCSAPFLGTALGFAFSQPPYVVLLIFATIAAGMSSPYILLTAQPAWMKYIPKPGVWMEKFKESMGFLLLATVVWLVWVLGQQVGINAAMAATGFLVALSFAVWLVGRFTDLTSSSRRKAIVYSIAALVMAASYYAMLRPYPELLSMQAAQSPVELAGNVSKSSPYAVATNVTEGVKWKPFSIAELDSQLAAGKTVFVDFTADWCLTCKVNESTVINTKPVIEKFDALKVVTLRADWTRQDPQISRLLQKFGRSGVPLYVIFPASRPTQPIVLPEVITADLVVRKLEEAGPSRN